MNEATNLPLPEGIYFEAKPAVGSSGHPYLHSYLVYRDGEGYASVIRGGPELGLVGDIEFQIDYQIDKSDDAYDDGETPADRHATQLDLGDRDPAEVWQQAVDTAKQIDTTIDYDLHPSVEFNEESVPELKLGADGELVQNSNSLIGTVLNSIDVPIENALPSGIPVELLSGIETNLFSSDVDKGIVDEFVEGTIKGIVSSTIDNVREFAGAVVEAVDIATDVYDSVIDSPTTDTSRPNRSVDTFKQNAASGQDLNERLAAEKTAEDELLTTPPIPEPSGE